MYACCCCTNTSCTGLYFINISSLCDLLVCFFCERVVLVIAQFYRTVSMSLLFMSSYILSLCLYLCTRASGGLILIAHQASKCLCHCVTGTLCYFAWQLIKTIRFVTLDFLRKKMGSCQCQILFALLSSDFTHLLFRCRMFGFVARRTGSTTENVCHLFAEMDPEQPAVAIVNFINKVMLGPQLRR